MTHCWTPCVGLCEDFNQDGVDGAPPLCASTLLGPDEPERLGRPDSYGNTLADCREHSLNWMSEQWKATSRVAQNSDHAALERLRIHLEDMQSEAPHFAETAEVLKQKLNLLEQSPTCASDLAARTRASALRFVLGGPRLLRVLCLPGLLRRRSTSTLAGRRPHCACLLASCRRRQ